MIRPLIFLACCLALTGCVNLQPKPDTVRQFVLGPLEGDSAKTAPNISAGKPIHVARPDLPGYLEGSRLLYRSAGGGMQNIPGARWGEPVQEGVARALSEYLNLGGYATNGFYPWPRISESTPLLRVRLHQFAATDDGRIHVRASWVLEAPDGNLRRGHYSSGKIEWEPGEAESLVRGLNQALETLADQIAQGN